MGANGVGAWKLGAVPHRGVGGGDIEEPGLNARQMISGSLDAALIYDFEPSLDLAEGAQATQVLSDTDQVIHIGPFVTPEILQYADVILPLAPLPETEGSLTNIDGLIQGSAAAAKTAGEARPGWKILKALADSAGLDGFDFTDFVSVHERVLEQLSSVQERSYEFPASLSTPAASPEPTQGTTQALSTLVETPMYAANGVVRRGHALQKTAHSEDGKLTAHPDLLSTLGLAEGEVEAVTGDDEVITIELAADGALALSTVRVAAGTAAASSLVAADSITLRAVSSDE